MKKPRKSTQDLVDPYSVGETDPRVHAMVEQPFFNLQRFRLLHDDDGHSYLVKVEEEADFYAWLNAGPYWEGYTGKEFKGLSSHFNSYSFCDPRQI